MLWGVGALLLARGYGGGASRGARQGAAWTGCFEPVGRDEELGAAGARPLGRDEFIACSKHGVGERLWGGLPRSAALAFEVAAEGTGWCAGRQ